MVALNENAEEVIAEVPVVEVEGEVAPVEGEQAPAEPLKNSYTLFYFNVKALAEPLRYLFAYGALEYEDVRVTRDEWPALKPCKYFVHPCVLL